MKRLLLFGVFSLGILAPFACAAPTVVQPADLPAIPADYYAEPVGQPYDEEVIEEKQEKGWHWKEFRYTSMLNGGVPTRVHAVYAAPDIADAQHKVPAIVMTHGVFGAVRGQDGRYWGALARFVQAGYAVIFFDWYPDFARNWKPANPDEPKKFTTFGNLEYFGANSWYLPGNDWKDSLHYQAMMAGRRAVSWISARPEIDTAHIGATGASYGGIFSSLLAAIEPRIVAVNPCVYTAGFGHKEDSYNMLPAGWTEAQVDSWRARFDSQVLLQKRKLPILYTIGANDAVFAASKAMDVFAHMNEPKHLLIGPNRGHDFWDVEQSVLFFDHALRNNFQRPTLSGLGLKQQGRDVTASVVARGTVPRKVEFFFSAAWEIDPVGGWKAVPATQWQWQGAEARSAGDGRYTAAWPLPVMRAAQPGERLYRWGNDDVWRSPQPETVLPKTTELDMGALRAFARVTDTNGTMECTPISEPLTFTDEPKSVITAGNDKDLPILEGAARVRKANVIDIKTDAANGEAAAHLDAELPVQDVGKLGYVLWNWRQQPPSTTLTTDGAATPTKRILAPIADTIPANSFPPSPNFGYNSRGNFTNLRVNAKDDETAKGHPWHGAVPVMVGGQAEIPIEATDNFQHHLTLLMPSLLIGSCNVRVSVRQADGGTATVLYRHNKEADALLQFRFQGKATLRVQITSQSEYPYHALVGPAALFFD